MAHGGEVLIKVMPDLSEFAAALTQHLDLDDQLAKAIINAPCFTGQTTPITAHVGDQSFKLHHWTITEIHGKRQLQTSWTRTDTDL